MPMMLGKIFIFPPMTRQPADSATDADKRFGRMTASAGISTTRPVLKLVAIASNSRRWFGRLDFPE